jgi:hypothetical protein
MTSRIYWLNGGPLPRLGIAARPLGGERLADEIAGWRSAGVCVIVSLLEAHEVHELGLQGEAAHALEQGMEFLSFPIEDRSVPGGFTGVRSLAGTIVSRSGEGGGVVVHCRAGIGRSSLIAASALVLCGLGAENAFRSLGAARGSAVPDTEGQRLWVSDFGAWVRETAVAEL